MKHFPYILSHKFLIIINILYNERFFCIPLQSLRAKHWIDYRLLSTYFYYLFVIEIILIFVYSEEQYTTVDCIYKFGGTNNYFIHGTYSTCLNLLTYKIYSRLIEIFIKHKYTHTVLKISALLSVTSWPMELLKYMYIKWKKTRNIVSTNRNMSIIPERVVDAIRSCKVNYLKIIIIINLLKIMREINNLFLKSVLLLVKDTQ